MSYCQNYPKFVQQCPRINPVKSISSSSPNLTKAEIALSKMVQNRERVLFLCKVLTNSATTVWVFMTLGFS